MKKFIGGFTPVFSVNEISDQTSFILKENLRLLMKQMFFYIRNIEDVPRGYIGITKSYIGLIQDELNRRKKPDKQADIGLTTVFSKPIDANGESIDVTSVDYLFLNGDRPVHVHSYVYEPYWSDGGHWYVHSDDGRFIPCRDLSIKPKDV